MPMFMVFLEKFVNSFNSGKLPSISSAYAALIENEIYEHAESAKETFRLGLAGTFGHAGPMELADLYFQINRLRDNAFEILNNCYMVGERNEELFEKYKIDLIEYMDKEEARLFEKNEELSKNNNQNILYNEMGMFLENMNEVYEDETKESDELVENVSQKLDEEVLQSYLDKKVGIIEEVPMIDQLKVFSFQILMGFKQNIRKIENRKKNMKFREDQLEENNFMRKKMELDLVEKTFKRNNQDLDDLESQVQRIREGGKNEQEIIELREEVLKGKKKLKEMDTEYENNKKVIKELNLNIEAKRKKKRKGCF